MDAFRRVFVNAADKILIDLLCHKRNHGRCRLGNSNQCGVQSHVCIDLILLHSLCPETFAAASYIPVAHVIYELLESTCCFRNTVIFKMIVHCFYHGVHFRQQPFIHNRKFVVFQRIFCSVKVVNIRVQNEKCICVPQSSHELSLAFGYSFAMETVRQPGRAVDVEVPADRVRAVFLQRVKGIHCISFGLAHFLAVFILNMAQNNNIFIRRLVENQRRDRQQGIEPSSCLVNRLGDKVRRELFFK